MPKKLAFLLHSNFSRCTAYKMCLYIRLYNILLYCIFYIVHSYVYLGLSHGRRQVTHLSTAGRTSLDTPTFTEERMSLMRLPILFFPLFLFSLLSLFSYSKAPAITLILRSLWALITAFISTLTCLMLFIQAGDDRHFEGNANNTVM